MLVALYLDLFHLHKSHGKYTKRYLLRVHLLSSSPWIDTLMSFTLALASKKSDTSQVLLLYPQGRITRWGLYCWVCCLSQTETSGKDWDWDSPWDLLLALIACSSSILFTLWRCKTANTSTTRSITGQQSPRLIQNTRVDTAGPACTGS